MSEEAEIAGKGAAEYILRADLRQEEPIMMQPGKGIRYTLPQRIDRCEDTTVFFRVTDVHAAVRILVKNGEETVLMRKRPRVAPGEMETVPAVLWDVM